MILSLLIGLQLALAEPSAYGPEAPPNASEKRVNEGAPSAEDQALFDRLLQPPKASARLPAPRSPTSAAALPLQWAMLIAGAGTLLLLAARRYALSPSKTEPGQLSVIAQLQVSPQSGLVVVQFEDRRFLVGTGPHPPTFLTDFIDSPDVTSLELLAEPTTQSPPATFEKNLAAHRYQENTKPASTPSIAPRKTQSLVEELLAGRSRQSDA